MQWQHSLKVLYMYSANLNSLTVISIRGSMILLKFFTFDKGLSSFRAVSRDEGLKVIKMFVCESLSL